MYAIERHHIPITPIPSGDVAGVGLAEATVSSLQEKDVSGSDNGVVRAVQRSINSVATQAKWTLVLVLPWPRTFGLIIVLTFCCVFVAALLFAICSECPTNVGHRRCGSLFFAVATQPQKLFASSCNAPLNL